MGTTDNSTWTRIQQGVRDAERLIGQKQYNMSMIRARQTLEYMVNSLGDKALIVDGDLADSIDQLFEGRWISQTTKDHYHRIRVLGNKAVHDGNDSPYDANEAYQLLAEEAHAFANTYNGSQHSAAAGKPVLRTATVTQRTGQATSARAGQNAGVRTGQSAGTRSGQASGARTAQAAGTRTGQTAGARAGQTGTRSGQTAARGGQRTSQRPGQRPSSSRSRRRPKKRGFDPYDLIKPALIFLVILIVIFGAVKLIGKFTGKPKETEPTTSAEITTQATEPTPTFETTEPAPAEPTPVIYKTTANPRLNVREQPSTTGALLGTLAFGTVVDYVDSYDDEWAIIMFEGKQAYVSKQYLSSEEAPAETSAGGAETSAAQ